MENETREKIKSMMEGLMYHCHEMTLFMSDHKHDLYFETEEGEKMRRYMIGITLNHVMALSCFFTDEIEKKKESFDNSALEELLKNRLI